MCSMKMSVAEYRDYLAAQQQGSNKYHAKKTRYRGRTYDSQAEACDARKLQLLKSAGEIVDFFEQVSVDMAPNGPEKEAYRVDFLVIPSTGVPYFYETKGKVTQDFRRLKRLWPGTQRLDLHVHYRNETEVVKGERHV